MIQGEHDEAFVDDETMDAVRADYETMDRMLGNRGYEGSAIQEEIRRAFIEMRRHRLAERHDAP